MIHIRNLDFRAYAVLSLLVLWASATFSIALMEISLVCALVFWVFSRLNKRGTGTFLGTGSPAAGGVPVPLQKGASPRIDWALWTPLALFFILVLASYFTSEYPKQSFRGIFKIAKPLLAFIMAACLFRDEKSRARFDLAFLITFLLVTIDSSIQYAFGKDLLRGFSAQDSSAGLRLVGPFGDFGKMSAYLILVLPIFALRFWNEFRRPGGQKKSLYVLALTIAAFTLLYLTRCRAPVVALVFSLGCLLIYKRWFKAVGIGLVLLLALLAFTPRGMFLHLDGQQKEQSVNERYYLWRRAIDVIVAKPLLGTGINTYDRAHAKYDTIQQKNFEVIQGPSTHVRQNQNGSVSFITGDTVFTSNQSQTILQIGHKRYNIHKAPDGKYYIYMDLLVRGYYAHNGYLQLAAEIGLPGIFFFLLFLVIFFKRGLRAARAVRGSPEELEQLGILTGLLSFLIYALADTNLQSPQCLISFWFLAGVLMARQSRHSAPQTSLK